MVVECLEPVLSMAGISRISGIPRSSLYYRKKEKNERRSRVPELITAEVIRIATERTTYGCRRIWAMLRNSGMKVNVKTVRRILRRNRLTLPAAEHRNRTKRRDLTKPDDINRLWETDIHYVRSMEGMFYLMSIKDCFSKKWIAYEFSRTCTAKDAIKAVEKAYEIRFPYGKPGNLVLQVDNGPQYTSMEFRETARILGIKLEYIQKHTPEDNGDIESFHASLKTDYIWVTDLETFEDARNLMEYAIRDYNSIRPHSSIGFLPPDEFEKRWSGNENFRKEFLEERRRKEEKRLRNRNNGKRRLKENVSYENGITVQN
ncbi:MAG: IS3 family transposase [Thermoplasmataceae archaeon]